jgi:flagellin
MGTHPYAQAPSEQRAHVPLVKNDLTYCLKLHLLKVWSILKTRGDSDSTTITFDAISTTLLGIASLDVSTSTTTAATAVDSIDDALDTVNTYQTYIGAMSNVMDSQYTVANDTVTNFSAAYGNIMNADYAAETAKLAAAQIQRDGAVAIMLQSNDLDRSLVDYLLKSLSN